jgi:uncharacterized protein (DUF488 family)
MRAMATTHAVVSVGYENRTIADLIAVLVANKVRTVVDVRELPLSRRRGFSKTALAASLEHAGIGYEHVRAAGNPHRRLKASTARCLAMYDRHLEQHPEVLDLVAARLGPHPVAFLCFERAHADCHRSRLLRALVAGRRHRVKVVQIE